MDQKQCDNLELAMALLDSLRDIMVSIESVDISQAIPVTTLIAFEAVIEKVQMLLKEVGERTD